MNSARIRRGGRLMTVAVAAVMALAACGSDDFDNGADGGSGRASGELSGSITVYAASSLTGAFNEIAEDFKADHPDVDITFDFGSSGDLSASIVEGAPADVFASAAPKNMDTVVNAGLAADPATFVSNTAVIVTAPGNPKGITSVADLAKPDVTVALCVATAPCGSVAASVVEKAGVTLTPTTNPPDVKSTLAAVESGEVDAGIVYVTDAKAAGDKVGFVEIPDDQNQSTDYPIAVLSQSANSDLAEAFVAYITGEGLSVLTAAGFAAP